MIKAAGGSVFLGAVALLGFLFYPQPPVEAFAVASQSLNDTTEFNQDNQTDRRLESTPIQTSSKNPENKTNEFSESSAFRATAYCLKGRTASGSGVRRGIVAADPRVLPLGSRIQVNAGAYSGIYTVADTGGGVKGRKLDIWVPNCSEAVRFGRKSVTVSRLIRKS